MELNLFTWWLCLAIVLVIAEVITTTVYLLFLSVTCLIVAILAWFNLSFIIQVVCASTLSLASICIVNWYKKHQNKKNLNYKDKSGKLIKTDMNNFDIGQVVNVNEWDGNTTKVLYKGAYWQAQYKSTDKYPLSVTGKHIIVDMQANLLLIEYKE